MMLIGQTFLSRGSATTIFCTKYYLDNSQRKDDATRLLMPSPKYFIFFMKQIVTSLRYKSTWKQVSMRFSCERIPALHITGTNVFVTQMSSRRRWSLSHHHSFHYHIIFNSSHYHVIIHFIITSLFNSFVV